MLFIGALLAALLSGCATDKRAKLITGGVPTAKADKARIYFYRANLPFLAALKPALLVNGQQVGTSVYGQAIYRDALPGHYQIGIASDPETVLDMNLAPGDTRYIRAFGTTTVIRSFVTIEEVPEAEALEDLEGQKLLPPPGLAAQ